MTIQSRFERQLTSHRLHQTQQRNAVIKCLAQNQPVARPSLVRFLAGKVDRSTVYRDINHFLKAGIIQWTTDHRLILADSVVHHHHAWVCRTCGRSIGFWNEALEKAIARHTKHTEFKVESHSLEISGLCWNCQPAQESVE